MAPLRRFLLLVASTLIAATGIHTHVEHERQEAESFPFEKRSRLHDMVLPMRIGLVHAHSIDPVDMLADTMNTASPNYGRRYTSDELTSIFAPSIDTIEAVTAWLIQSNVSKDAISLSHNRQWIQFDASTREVESLLLAEYWQYEHSNTGKTVVGCDKYHIPALVRPHVDYITPAVKTLELRIQPRDATKRSISPGKPQTSPMPFPVAETVGQTAARPCFEAMTPDCIKRLYQINDTVLVHPQNTLGVYERGDYIRQDDLDDFFFTYFPKAPNGTFPTLVQVDGAPKLPDLRLDTNSVSDLESSLDLEIFPLVYPNEIQLFQVDDIFWASNFGPAPRYGLFNTLLDAIDGSYCDYEAFGVKGDSPRIDPVYPDRHNDSGQADPNWKHPRQCGVFKAPGVLAVSYSWDEQAYPESYSRRQCNEFARLAMQGTTVVVSSGDLGVTGHTGNGCTGPKQRGFTATSPSTCPAILSVGATVLAEEFRPGFDPERAPGGGTVNFENGGGFSNYFKTPSWQEDVISKYFADNPPPYPFYNLSMNESIGANGGVYNRGGRGFPDVSAIGHNITTFTNNNAVLGGGTSAAAPVIAGMISRINAYRLAAGKSTVGFVNPVLYAHPEIFNDITVGHNEGCFTRGFSCEPGWDPVTGLGSPKYPLLKKVLMDMP